MALTSGDIIVGFSSWTQLENTGASISAGGMSAAAATECTSAIHEDAALIELAISAEFGANTPTEGKTVDVYYKANDLGVTSQDGNVPTTAHLNKYLGSAVLKAVAGTQYLHLTGIVLPTQNFNLYIKNGDDTDAMTWKMWLRPWTTRAKT